MQGEHGKGGAPLKPRPLQKTHTHNEMIKGGQEMVQLVIFNLLAAQCVSAHHQPLYNLNVVSLKRTQKGVAACKTVFIFL